MIEKEARGHLELGQAYRIKKDYESALKELRQAEKLELRDFELHLELGRTYREKGDFDSAIKSLNRAIEFGFNNNETHLELGRTLREKKDYPAAIEELNIALRYAPSDGRIHLELGRVYHQQKDYDASLRELNKAVKHGFDNDEIHLELGRVYREKRQYRESIEEFKAALSHNPSDARMHLELGWIYHNDEKYNLAVNELEEAVRLGIDTEELHISLGRMYRKAGEYELSVNEFRKAIENNQNKNNLFFRNKLLNEIEISQKKVILESKPIGLGITLTNKCNLRCRICGVWKEKWELPKRTIQEITDLFPFLERIVWQGGEVFLLDYFEELFEKGANYPNLKQSIVTNGLLIDERLAKKLARDNVTIIYSIDALNDDAYEYITGEAKFKDLIRSINLINEFREKNDCHKDPFNKMTTIMNVVIMESNYQQLEEFLNFAKDYRFDEMQLVPILGVKGPENIFANQDQKAGKYLTVNLPKISGKANDYGIVLHNWLPSITPVEETPAKEMEHEQIISAGTLCVNRVKKETICYLPWQQMFMTPDRKLKPGCYCRKDIGDINTDSLESIWNGEIMQLYRKKLLENDYTDVCDSVCVSGVIPRKELKVSRYW